MSSLAMPTRWYNNRLPQTLVISQFLLYFDAFWAVLDLVSVGANPNVQYTTIGRIIVIASIAGYIYGAGGIASEYKLGYKVAVAASFLPLTARVVNSISAGVIDLGYILVGSGLIGALFEYALIGLLLHSQSREHQRIWFS